MAKTLSQMLADWRQLIAQPDAANSNFSDAQGTIWANDAYRRVVTKLRNLPIKIRDYTVSAQSVTLNSGTVTIDVAKIKNPDNSDKYKEIEIITLEDLVKRDPDWESTTSAVPSHLVRMGTFLAHLWPPPKASVIALTTPLRTYGLELPTELSGASDTPDVPGNLHDIFPHWMAGRSFQFLGKDEQAGQQFAFFNGQLRDQLSISREFSRGLKRWRWEDAL